MQAISLSVCVCATNASNALNSVSSSNRSPRHSITASLTSVQLAMTTVSLEHALYSQSEWWALQGNTNEQLSFLGNDPNCHLQAQAGGFFHKVPSMEYLCEYSACTLLLLLSFSLFQTSTLTECSHSLIAFFFCFFFASWNCSTLFASNVQLSTPGRAG